MTYDQFISRVKAIALFFLDKRKEILTYVTFIVVLQNYARISWAKQDLQDVGPNMLMLLAALLGIDLLHDVAKSKNGKPEGGDATKPHQGTDGA